MNAIEAIERLSTNDIVDKKGNVRTVADMSDPDITAETTHGLPMKNEARIAYREEVRRSREAEIDAERDLDLIRVSADFSNRNNALTKMATSLGAAKRHEGAAIMLSEGNRIPYYKGDWTVAEKRATEASQSAKEFGEIACAACPLRDDCFMTYDKLQTRLQDPKVRNRFRHRVEDESNNHLCETNLKPGCQDKKIA